MRGVWAEPKQELIRTLGTNELHGLTSSSARTRLTRHGLNELKEEGRVSPWRVWLRQFQSPLIYILLIAGLVALTQGHYLDAGAVYAVVVINSIIGWFQEYRAEKTIAQLKRILAPKARVIRDSQEQRLDARYLVPGDIIIVEAGDRVPADARLLQSQDLRVNQASLTGESVPAHKNDRTLGAATALIDRQNMIYLSTLVVTGQGVAVVTGTGMGSELGTISREVASVRENPAVMTKQINRLGRWLLGFATIFSLGVAAFGLITGLDLTEMLATAISLLVSIVPEGLPIAVTVLLSIGLLRAFRYRVLIRKLTAAETLGSVSVICADKTGTITEGNMAVVQLLVGGELITVTGTGYHLSGHFQINGETVDIHKRPGAKLLLELTSLATSSTISPKDLAKDEARQLTDPTETALAVVAAKAGYYAFKREAKNPELLEIPFDQEARYSTSVHQFDAANRYITKGAPEQIIRLSNRTIGAKGQLQRLLPKSRAGFLSQAEQLAARGFRVVALGYVDQPKGATIGRRHVADLVFVGFLALADPVRADVPTNLRRAQAAGIRTIMATGDHFLTAQSIATAVGLLPGAEVIHADDIRHHDLSQVAVIARATPSEKLLLIERLQQKGEVVAMTGDGVNDAPALKKADIGIAMGRGGTDVAVEAADMVLLDNGFAGIIHAIAQGRLIWENLKKVIFLLVSTALSESLIILSALLLGLPLPIVALQILWVNLVTDGINALALTTEPPEEDLMKKRPSDFQGPFLTGSAYGRMFLLLGTMASGTVLVFILTLDNGLAYARTAAMTTLVFFQLGNVFNCRSATRSIFTGSLQNAVPLVTVAIAFLLQIAAIYLPIFQKVLGTTFISASDLFICLVAGVSIIFVDEVRKLLARGLTTSLERRLAVINQ